MGEGIGFTALLPIPAKDKMCVETVGGAWSNGQRSRPQTSSKVGSRVAVTLGPGLWAAVAAVQREGRAGGDRIGAAGVLLPQVAADDVIKSGWCWRHTRLCLLSNGWSLRVNVNRAGQSRGQNWTFWARFGLPG